MKTNSFTYITVGFAAALATPGFALEAPADDSPPPAASKHQTAQLPEIKLQQPDAKPAVESAFLGVVSGEVPAMLAEHLDLNSKGGVIVRSLVPDGPAAKAGLAVNDVITRVAGNPVGSPQELAVQITAHKPGDDVALDIIHKGKPSQLTIALGLRPDDLASSEPQTLDPLKLEGIPRDLAERIRKAVEGNLGGLDLQHGADEAGPKMEEAMRELKKRMQGAMGQGFALPGDDAGGKVQVQGGATVRMNDAKGSVEVKSTDGSKEVTLRDPQNNVVWNGPWDTAQDKEAAPAEVRQRVEGLNIDNSFKGAGLRLQLNQPEAGDR